MVVELKLSLELLWGTKTGTYHRQEKDPTFIVFKTHLEFVMIESCAQVYFTFILFVLI